MAGDVGVVTCVDAKPASVWRERLGGIYTASPIAGDGRIYLFGESGGRPLCSGPAAPRGHRAEPRRGPRPGVTRRVEGRLFIRTDDEVVAVRR